MNGRQLSRQDTLVESSAARAQLEQLADGEPEIQSRLKVWRDMLSAATTQARQTPSLHQNLPPITLELLFWSWGVPNERQWSHR